MTRYLIDYEIRGRAWIEVEASSLAAAKKIARDSDHPDIPPSQVEWAYEDVNSVSEVKGG